MIANIEQIRRSNHSEYCFLLMNKLAASKASSPSVSGERSFSEGSFSFRRLLFRMYEKVDKRTYGSMEHPIPDELVDCSDLLAGIPRITAVPQIGKRTGSSFSEADLAKLDKLDLDVILRLGFRTVPMEILQSARYGVWSYRHADHGDHREGPGGFWEIVERAPVTGVLLQRVIDRDNPGTLLVEGFTSTRQGVSLVLNRFDQYWLGSLFVLESLFTLHQHGIEVLTKKGTMALPRESEIHLRRPTTLQTAALLSRNLGDKVRGRISNSSDMVHHWRIAIRCLTDDLDGSSPSSGLKGFRWLESPKGRFWADPFILDHDGQCWLFFEDYLYGYRRGVISAARLDSEGQIEFVEKILDTGSHLSYPFIYKDGGEIFLLPESSNSGVTTLYRARDFPRKWEKIAELGSDIAALDTTIWKQGERFWFFVTTRGAHGGGYTLLLFSAESLAGPWAHHPMSPISHDVRDARSGGAIFRSGTRVIRPAQDCSRRYGRALHFQDHEPD